ncbi:MAG TPA: TRAM domain-containing protein [Candidatus Nanoarchaeia archaeon]|nr:TRAM domain-containing protein [Candidatus Nanoarchaeia archaeon]
MYEITIESLASTGLGVGRVTEDGFTRAVFVPFSCPGDTIRVKINERKKKYYTGEIAEILKESPFRQPIRCRHFGVCGGCDLLHIKYDKQVEMKREFLKFIFKDYYNGEIKTIVGNPDYYRDKARIHSDRKNAGWKKFRSDEIVNVEECMLVNPSLLAEFEKLRGSKGEYVLVADENGVTTWNIKQELTMKDAEDGNYVCSYMLKGQKILFSASCFIQSNSKLNEKLVNIVVDEIRKENPKEMLELFSGVGNFSSQIDFCKVTCVEGDKISSYFGKINARHCTHMNQDVYKFLEANRQKYDVVLLDPPRGGIADEYAKIISEMADTIIYVSCDANALKGNLKEMNGFRLERLWLVDMFPHTHHVEIVAVLKRNKASENNI